MPIKVMIKKAITNYNPGILNGRYLFGLIEAGMIAGDMLMIATVKQAVIPMGIITITPVKK